MSSSQARLTWFVRSKTGRLCLSRNYFFVPLKMKYQLIYTPKDTIHSITVTEV